MTNDYRVKILPPDSKKLRNYRFQTDNNKHCKKYGHSWVKCYPAKSKPYTECFSCGTAETED